MWLQQENVLARIVGHVSWVDVDVDVDVDTVPQEHGGVPGVQPEDRNVRLPLHRVTVTDTTVTETFLCHRHYWQFFSATDTYLKQLTLSSDTVTGEKVAIFEWIRWTVNFDLNSEFV